MRKLLPFALVLTVVAVAYAAIDTEDKRRAAVSQRVMPLADGDVEADDRAQLAGVYRMGFEDSEPSPGSSGTTTGNALGHFLFRRKGL